MKQTFLKWIIVTMMLFILSATGVQAAEIHRAASAGDLETVKKLLGQNPRLLQEVDENGRTLLHWACRGVHLDLVKYLVGQGANVNARDTGAMTPLHSVASRGHLEAAKLLLDAGARIDAETKGGWSALHLAASNGHSMLAAFIMEKGARLNAKDGDEDTPLHAAAYAGKWDVVDFLTDRLQGPGAAVLNLGDFDGCTVLHLASRDGRLETVRRLVAKGADLNLRNTAGQTAYNLADQNGYAEITAFLARKGADRSSQKFPLLSGPYLGQSPPGAVPQLFAKGIVSTRSGMYGTITFSPDGCEAFWRPEGPEMLFMKMEKRTWSAPQEVPFKVQDARHVPFFSHDGRRLYFMAALRDPQGMDKQESIWFAERKGEAWSDPQPFDPVINSVPMHWQFSLDRQGNVYLSSGGGIRCACIEGGRYSTPKLLPAPVNREHSEEEKYMAGELGPFISPAGDYLIYTKIDARSPLPSQLLISFKRKDGGWSEPRNLSEKLGNAGNDSMAKLSPDGKYLFFQSDRAGSGASRGLYWVDAGIIQTLRPPVAEPH